MDIQIVNGVPIGIIRIKHPYTLAFARIHYRPTKDLYNFYYECWHDFNNDIATIRMRGSIISMMQFRKFISLNCPDLKVW